MIKYYTSSTYRKHYSDLERLNMLNQVLEVEPYQLSLYVLRNPKDKCSSVSQESNTQKCFVELIQDLQVYKSLQLTPIKAFKSLLLIHCTFLLVKISPNQQNIDQLNSYFKWILESTVNMIQKYSNKENKKRNDSTDKTRGFLAKSAKSLRFFSPGPSSKEKAKQRPKSTGKHSNEQILSKQLCVLSNIVKPYILYLQKILAIYPQYQNLMRSIPSTIQTSSESVWTVLNIFKLMAPIVSIFVYIGRYFYKDYSQIVHLLIDFFSKQVNRLYPVLRVEVKRKTQKIEHEWFALQAKYSEYEIIHNPDVQISGVGDAMLLIDEILKINDSLFYIFYSKHFYSFVEKLRLPAPSWLQINSKDCQFLINYVESKNRIKKRKSSRDSKDKRNHDVSTMILPAQITKKSPRVNNLIDKKTILPKPKKFLKLNDTPRQEPITFRVKESRDKNDIKRNCLGEISFSNEGSTETERSQNADDIENKN